MVIDKGNKGAWHLIFNIDEWGQNHRLILFAIICLIVFSITSVVDAGVQIPGDNKVQELKAAGTLLKILDTALFVWIARVLAGLAILSAGWAFKEQKFGMAVVAVGGAIIIGTAPVWVSNLFNIGGGGGVFTN